MNRSVAASTGAEPSAPTDVLSTRTVWLHGSMGLPLAVIGYPLSIWIPAHYAGALGLPLATVGTLLMLARLSDVITDPLIGELSDHTRTRIGRRRPYLLAGAPLMMLGAWCLFVPPAGAGMIYFLLWLTLFFLGSTLIQLPHAAWGAELSPDYHQRSRVSAAREVYVLAGLMIAAAVPMIVEIMADRGTGLVGVADHAWRTLLSWLPGAGFEAPAGTAKIPRAALTGPVLEGLAITVIALLPVCASLVAFGVAEPRWQQTTRVPLREGLRMVARNGPMKRVLLIALLVYFGEAFRNAVSLFFIRDIIGLGSIGSAYFLYFLAGIAAIPFWLGLGQRIGKHRAFMCTLITVGCVSAANFFLGYGDYEAFFALFIVKGFCFGGLQFLPAAMLADVVDIDSMRTGGRRAGAYFALMGMTVKLAIAFGTGASLNAVGLLGFDAAGGVEGSTALGVLTLRIVYTMGPVLFFGSALYLVWSYPLTPVRHARLRASLARREARLAARIAP
ncbi:MAG: MFS transporter [Pseudomonadales bacterium]|jgi:Na+/melibiose symporter-like transporter|nr:MFS transporter [Pseudomonadales bacterium]